MQNGEKRADLYADETMQYVRSDGASQMKYMRNVAHRMRGKAQQKRDKAVCKRLFEKWSTMEARR